MIRCTRVVRGGVLWLFTGSKSVWADTGFATVAAGYRETLAGKSHLLSGFPDWFGVFLINGILFFAAMLVLSAAVIIVQKIVVEWRTAHFEKCKEQYLREITGLLFDPSSPPLSPVRRSMEFQAASDIVIELMEAVDDPGCMATLHHYLNDSGIMKHYLSLATRGRSFRKLDAVERIALFRSVQNRPMLTGLLSDRSNDEAVRMSALIGLSYIFRPEDMEIFLSSLKSIDTSGKFSEFLFYNLLKRLVSMDEAGGIESVMERLLSEADPFLLKAFIEAVAVVGYDPCASRLVALYRETPRDDVKISLIRALGNLRESEEGCALILEAMHSDNTTLRIVASNSIGRCRTNDACETAFRALFDTSYRVRHNIARSLLRIPNGIERLKEAASGASDPYARQSAAYALRWMETSNG